MMPINTKFFHAASTLAGARRSIVTTVTISCPKVNSFYHTRLKEAKKITHPQYHGTIDQRFPFKRGDAFRVNDGGFYICDQRNAILYATGDNTSCRRAKEKLNSQAIPLVVQIEAVDKSDINPLVGVSDRAIEFSPPGSGWNYIRPNTELVVKEIFTVTKEGTLVPYNTSSAEDKKEEASTFSTIVKTVKLHLKLFR